MPHNFDIDKNAVANSFSKAAPHYDQFAQLQRDIGYQLLSLVTEQQPKSIMDLGCGTGYFSQKLAQQFPSSALTCFDLSSAMLEQAKTRDMSNVHFQQGDIDSLAYPENSLELIFSNLVIQWSADLSHCLQQIKNCMKKQGRVYISTLLDGTLHELCQAWKSVDSYPHTNNFLTLDDVKQALNNCGFSSVNVKTETRVLQYGNVLEVMRALKGIGANHVHRGVGQSNLLKGQQLINKLQAGYSPFINEQGQLNLTYQVCYIEIIK